MFWRYRKHRRPLAGLRLGHTLWSGLILASLAGVPAYAQEWRRVGTVDNSTVTTTALCNWKASGDIECPIGNPRVSSGALAVGTATPDASAAMDITSTEKGFLPPRLTTAQVTAVATPADGLIVYDSDTDTLKLRADGAWVSLATGSTTPAPDSLDFTEFKDEMTLDASTDIAASGTNVLSITNTGTGNSFVVNDEASDATPFVVDASGRVGIGTASPLQLLDVLATAANSGMRIQNTAGAVVLALTPLNSSSWSLIDNTRGQFLIRNSETSGTGHIGFRAGGSTVDHVRIASTGMFGLGTTSPTYLLSLGGNAARTVGMERHTTADTAGNALTLLAGGATSGATDKAGGDLVLSSGTATGTGTSKIEFKTHPAGTTGTGDSTATTQMTILGNGNVGIGTTAPNSRLEVTGGPAGITPVINVTNTGSNAGGIGVLHGIRSVIFMNRQATDAYGIYSLFNSSNNGVPQTALYGEATGQSTIGGQTIGVRGKSTVVAGAYSTAYGIYGEMASTGTGGNSLSYAGYFNNTATSGGTNFGLYVNATTGGADAVPIAVSSDGVERLRVTSAGNLGIGTTTPAYRLHASGDIATAGRLLFTRTGVIPAYIEMVPGGDNSEQLAIWTRYGGYTKDFAISRRNILLAQATAGLVGIGTATPQSRLDISGGARIGSDPVCSAAKAGMLAWNSNKLQICTDAGTFTDLANSTGVIGGSSQWINGTSGAIYYDGNVGIGTDAPGSKLDIVGDAKVSGKILANGTSNTPVFGFNGNAAAGMSVSYGKLILQSGGVGASNIAIALNTTTDYSYSSANDRLVVLGNGNIGIATTAPSYVLSLGGDAARAIGMERHTTANTAGSPLTLLAGGATLGATDKAGGDLVLTSGTATGTGSSKIEFRTAAAQGASATTDNAPTTKMTILGNGNVGIGTTTPGSKLVVSADTAGASLVSFVNSAGRGMSIRPNSDGTGAGGATLSVVGPSANFQFAGDLVPTPYFGYSLGSSGVPWLSVYTQTVKGRSNASEGKLDLRSGHTSQPLTLGLDTTEYLRVHTNGNVGIGTSAPTAALHVKGADTVFEYGTNGFLRTTADASAVYLQPSPPTPSLGTFKDLRIGPWMSNAPYVTVKDGGNVGIGTTAPAAKLDVAGEVKLASTGLACSAATEGTQRYNSTSKTIEFCNGSSWASFFSQAVQPNAFAFTDVTGATPGATVSSNAITLGGFPGTLTATCSGCTAIARNGAWGGTVVSGFAQGDTIAIRVAASASFSTAVTATASVGGTVSGTWTVSTVSNIGPNAFGFTDVANAATTMTYTSNTVTLSGFTGTLTATCNSCTGIARNGVWGISPYPGFVSGDTIAIRQTSSAGGGVTATAAVTLGSTTSNGWGVTTATACTTGILVGEACPDGSIFAGFSPDGTVPMYTTPCDAGQTLSGGSCTGTRSGIKWNNGSSTWTVTGYTSLVTGLANTAGLVALIDGGAPYQAAAYCDGLTAHGKSDWYLPARNELNILYTNRTAIGGFDVAGGQWYWSSSESVNFYAWIQRFSDGSDHYGIKNYSYFVRCARR